MASITPGRRQGGTLGSAAVCVCGGQGRQGQVEMETGGLLLARAPDTTSMLCGRWSGLLQPAGPWRHTTYSYGTRFMPSRVAVTTATSATWETRGGRQGGGDEGGRHAGMCRVGAGDREGEAGGCPRRGQHWPMPPLMEDEQLMVESYARQQRTV